MTKSVLKPVVDTESPQTGIEGRYTPELAEKVSEALADTYVLLVKTQGIHWNVVGPLFVSIHELTEQQYNDLFEAADELAERVRALGHPAPMGFAKMAEMSIIDEIDGPMDAQKMVATLADDHSHVARRMRDVAAKAEEMGDLVTTDMLVARMTVHEKAAWMLRSIIAD